MDFLISLLINFGLKSILSDIKMSISAGFLVLSAWNIFFYFFFLTWMVRCVPWMPLKDGSRFCIPSVSLCTFIGESRLLVMTFVVV